jgi:hypothetical protein
MATPTSLPGSFSDGNPLTALQMNNLRGAFRVLQVVYGSTNTATSSSSSTFSDTTLSATITPSSASNLVLVLVHQTGCGKNAGSADTALALRLLRGASTELIVFETIGGYTGTSSVNYFGAASCVYLDNPSTTSATTYKTQMRSTSNLASVSVQTSGAGVASRSTICLMEISA